MIIHGSNLRITPLDGSDPTVDTVGYLTLPSWDDVPRRIDETRARLALAERPVMTTTPSGYSTSIEFTNVNPEMMRILMGNSPAQLAQSAFEQARQAVLDGEARTTARITELRAQRADINEEIKLLLTQQTRLRAMARNAQEGTRP